MAPSVLVAFATKRGSTREVAEAIAATLSESGVEVELRPAAESGDVGRYAGIVLGGPLYTGRWHRDARRFLARRHRELADKRVAIFAVGPLKLDEKQVTGSRRQLDRALAKARGLEPVSVAIFGGVIDPAKLRFPFNRMPAGDARDWDAIRAWAREIATDLLAAAPIRSVAR
jgi:menaquinone-dependent protoporphyrinogen oxidase